MSENENGVAKTESAQKQPAQKANTDGDAKLLANIQIALELPLPSKADNWKLAGAIAPGVKKGLLRIFKKKEFSEEEMSKLRQEAESAPGQARVKIQMMGKKFASNNALNMLSAYCTYRMVLNSANQKEVLEGLKSATKDAAFALISNGISLYHVETFLTIYFEYLSRLKRFQIRILKNVKESGSQRLYIRKLETAIKLCDTLVEEKSRATKVLSQIKGKFKSSSYTILWEFDDIQKAGKKMEQSDYKAICGPTEARELIVYTLAMTEIFARIPILSPLVESVLKLTPDSTNSLFLKKSSIQVTLIFSQLNTAILEEDIEHQRTFSRQIVKISNDNIQKIANQPIKQSFEADSFFHLSRVTILTFGIYNGKEQKIMLLNSIKAMQHLAKLDVSKNHVYTESAQKMVKRLTFLLSEGDTSSSEGA
ncbi:MAG: hypothetical protein HQ517_07890 [SAR324 cluster bacterium]|nr:hypothetical protein [SAR324 cluster bacterium]